MNASMARATVFFVCFILEKTNQFLFYLFYSGSLNLYIVHCMYAKLTLVCIKKKYFLCISTLLLVTFYDF